MKVSQLLEMGAAPKASTRIKTPAYLRKAKGGDWKIKKADLEAAEAENISGEKGLEKRKAELGVK